MGLKIRRATAVYLANLAKIPLLCSLGRLKSDEKFLRGEARGSERWRGEARGGEEKRGAAKASEDGGREMGLDGGEMRNGGVGDNN